MAQLSFDRRLESLLATAAQVFADNGYHSTSMRELSRAVGMSLAGMYHYVRGKDELLFLIQQRCFTRVLEGAERALAGAADPVSRLERFIEHHVTFFARHMAEMKVLSHEAQSLSEERQAPINALKRRYVDLLLGLLDELDREGARRLEPRVAAFALFGMMNWIYTWYDPNGTVSPDELARQFTTLFLHGVTLPATAAASHGG